MEIKKFLKHIAVLGMLAGITLVIFVIYRNYADRTEGFGVNENYAIAMAKERQQYTTVMVGDSVCHQLFQPENQSENSDVCYLGTVQSVTVLGNYILLCDYLENNPQTEKVIYMAGPPSFANDMWLDFSYQYFVLLFYTEENMKYVDADTQAMLREKFGEKYVENTNIKEFLLENPFFLKVYLNKVQQQLETKVKNRICDLSATYIRKIQQLCEEKGVELEVICSPLDTNNKIGDLDLFAEDIVTYGLQDIMGDYLENIKYYEDSCFMDNTHFTTEYLEEHREDIIRDVFGEFPIH